MLRYLARKVVVYVLTFFVAVTIDWAIPRFMPGDPVEGLLSRMHAQPSAEEALSGYYTEAFGFDVPIVLRSLEELKAMVKANPFGREPGQDAQLHVLLLDQDLPKGYKQAGLPGDYDVSRAAGGEIYYIVYRKDDGTYLGRSDLKVGEGIPKGTVMTMRNWNTILKAIA